MTDTVGTASDTSPEALLKRAVMGARTKAAPKPVAGQASSGQTSTGPVTNMGASPPRARRIDPRLAGLVGAALLLGGAVGAGASRLGATNDGGAAVALAEIQRRLGAAQAETDRVAATLAQIGKTLAHTQETVEAARTEARTRSGTLVDRVARAEQALAAKVSTLGERVEQSEKDQAGRLAALTAQVEKRLAPPVQAAVKPAAEPTVTGALPDAKTSNDTRTSADARAQADAKAQAAAKPPASDNWAVREVYDGIAVLEDRKRRLVEVGIGDTVPGVGRIETIERRGRAWAVVTRQGIITPQAW